MALRRVSLPAPQPLVRPATLADAAALCRLFELLGRPCAADEMRARMWASPPWRAVLVADVGLAVRGAAVVELLHPLHRRARDAALTAVVADPDCRHRGVGRALVANAVAWARREGCCGLSVRAPAPDDGGHAFLRAVGFEETHLTFDWKLAGA